MIEVFYVEAGEINWKGPLDEWGEFDRAPGDERKNQTDDEVISVFKIVKYHAHQKSGCCIDIIIDLVIKNQGCKKNVEMTS